MPRFTIRNLLIGTAWFAAWGALILNYQQILFEPPLLLIPYVATLIALPFVALGAMLGNAKEGFLLGLFFAIVAPSLVALIGLLVAYLSMLLGR